MSSAMQTLTQHSPPSQYAPTSSSQAQSLPHTHSSHSPQLQARLGDNAAVSSSPLAPQQFYSPSSAVASAMSSPRNHPLPPSTHASPVTPTPSQGAGTPRNRPIIADVRSGPPIPPPRTSSNHRSRTSSAVPSNASSADQLGTSGRSKQRGDEPRDRADRERTAGRDRPRDDVTNSATRSRRKNPHSPEIPHRAASTRERRDPSSANAIQSRSEAAMGPSSVPGGPVREANAVPNSAEAAEPEIDIMGEHERQADAQPDPHASSALAVVGNDGVEDVPRSARTRQDYSNSSSRRKETTFGEYILGQTIGEGEFGKVKLGWKKDGSVQVAIKLIRRESLGTNPSRLPKIYREISILRELSHPNIVRLHEMVETDRHIGIILEYASGGELFDYILLHRYLKDNSARRLFAQLVSGVGYLHKKGIVHRDLKLENLLLDRNRNIIITDFGFANTFNPIEELGEEIEYNLTNKDFVKRMRLDRTDVNGMRRGDLMQTSCGSPCYAAPELVVSDSLYTGRKVDIWSCGVILYAMLAGYLPFDDDPANPEGDNINLLYKYIVTTPLTFPEYVTPHARDLLRRILVPDPRKRADLFEVARHSWLTEYAHVMAHITSNTTNVADIANTTVPAEDHQEGPSLARSASVREPPKSHQSNVSSPVGGLNHQQGKIAQDEAQPKAQRDAKRRTVQVEYVAPQSQTVRGESRTESTSLEPAAAASGSSHQRARSTSREPTAPVQDTAAASRSKPLPKDPPVSMESGSRGYGTTTAERTQGMPHPSQPYPSHKGVASSISDLTGAFSGTHGAVPQTTRPQTGGSMASTGGRFDGRLPSRGSYSQPAAPAVATTNAQGRLAQPKSGKHYNISAPIPQQTDEMSIGLPSARATPTGSQRSAVPSFPPPKGHKRSSTVTSIGEKLFGRPVSLFGSRPSQPSSPRPRSGKRYPPTSMKEPHVSEDPRASMDSRRSISHAFHRKTTDNSNESRPRRFSLLPPSFSLKSFSSSSKEPTPTTESYVTQVDDFIQTGNQGPQRRQIPSAPATAASVEPSRNPNLATSDGTQGSIRPQDEQSLGQMDYAAHIDQQFAALHATPQQYQYEQHPAPSHAGDQGYYQSDSNVSASNYNPQHQQHGYGDELRSGFSEGYSSDFHNSSRQSIQTGRSHRGNTVLQKPNRKFADAYEYEKAHHSGSSGAARKVMDFFRRRGKARTGEDR
ncbi:CAMK/CAMKL/KIN4 protein kinase [Polytolypa hystricis UAMH7299]|uniref:non-specific serine/threonine protein kinase n=1 Tax=Polytolypa hystricis (strain UAMH7299) TaxID=1447883 RepID=A0A2B7Z5P9_POLH7|nr:CAMK/CAMKL/KIN4 protein kinase [Polytolypa hystricis UAMH7299]